MTIKDHNIFFDFYQITVYTNNTLYTEGCVENSDTCDGEVVSPVTVVTTDEGNVGSVNVTFNVSHIYTVYTSIVEPPL